MGNKLSKASENKESNMTSDASSSANTPPPAATVPRLPLIAGLWRCVLTPWKAFAWIMKKNGICKCLKMTWDYISSSIILLIWRQVLKGSMNRRGRINEYFLTDEKRQARARRVWMTLRMFEENYDPLHLFDKFREFLSEENDVMWQQLAQCSDQIYTIQDKNIRAGDMDFWYAYIQNIGASISSIPGFKDTYFEKIEAPFLAAVKFKLGNRYTSKIEDMHKVTIKFIIKSLIDGFYMNDSFLY